MQKPVAPSLCESCHSINRAPHQNMRHQGIRQAASSNGAQERQYRCVACNAIWVEPIDRWGISGGFRLLPNVK